MLFNTSSINNVEFRRSNESLEAVALGMDLHPEDVVASILGSSEQSLAILEYVARVIAMDIDSNQINISILRLRILKEGNMKRFKSLLPYSKEEDGGDFISNVKDNKKYLSMERLDRISKKLMALDILYEDIFDVDPLKMPFNKLYISNALNYGYGQAMNIQSLGIIASKMPKNGLIYSATDDHLEKSIKSIVAEEDLTHKARMKEHKWNPIIYRII